MKNIRFIWDDAKNRGNLKKHGIGFEEARSVFHDPHAVEFFDDSHSDAEDRFLMLGMSSGLRLLLVCHCFRGNGGDAEIRLISARRATKKESKEYGWESVRR